MLLILLILNAECCIIIKCISDDNRIIRRSNEEIYDKLNEISTLFSLQIEKNKIKHQEEN